jgi:hypothetical protein
MCTVRQIHNTAFWCTRRLKIQPSHGRRSANTRRPSPTEFAFEAPRLQAAEGLFAKRSVFNTHPNAIRGQGRVRLPTDCVLKWARCSTLMCFPLRRNTIERCPTLSVSANRGALQAATWRGSYIEGKSHRSISLHDRTDVPQLVAPLARGGRLLLEASAGPLNPTKSPVEHKLLFGLIGRALCYEDVDAGDVLAIAVPRSARFRQLIARFRKSPRLEKTALVSYLVARGGDIDGMQKLKRQ